MLKLNSIVAVATGLKARTQKEITELHRLMGHDQGMRGLSRTYHPRDEEGEALPSEMKVIQVKTDDILNDALAAWKKLWEVVITQDYANCGARADITVSGKIICSDVPVTTILWLQKQVNDLYTFVQNIPVLDSVQEWQYSEQTDCFTTKIVQTTRTKKVLRNHVKAEATKEHPAQVDVYQEDIVVGTWDKVEYSGMMQASKKTQLLKRVEVINDALKVAKERANEYVVEREERFKDLFNYIKQKEE